MTKKALLFLAFSVAGFAQYDRPVRYWTTDPTGACNTVTPLWNNWVAGKVWQCVGPTTTPGAGSWQLIGGGGGSSAFSALTTGSNTTAVMTVGSGANLTFTGTGIINASKILGTTITGLTGPIKFTSGIPSVAVATDIIGLFSACSGSQYLGADGSCHNAAGAGTVTSVGLSAPAWLTVGGSPVTTAGTLALTATTGQTSHQVIGTCGAGTSFAPCALVVGDLPTGYLYSNLSGAPTIVYQLVGNNGTSQTARNRLNFVPGTNVTFSFADNGGTNSTDVTINATAGATGNAAQLHTVTFSSTPALTCTSGSAGTVETFELSTTLTANITPTISGCTSGQTVNIRLKQDATGGRTVTWPAAWNTLAQPSPLANIETTIVAVWDGTSGKGSASSDGQGTCPEQAAPGVSPPAGSEFPWCDSTGLFPRWRNSSGTIFQASKELTAGNVRVAGGANAVDTALALTTTGTSGASTLSGGTLNIPQYASGVLSGTLAAIPATCTVGVSIYQATDQPITLQLYACTATNTWTRQDYTQGTTASKPATCSVGQTYFSTDATAGQNWFFCTATNTWTQQLNSGGGGGTNMCSDMFTTPGSITFNVTAGHVNCITVSGTYTVTAAVALANANVSIVALTPGVIIKQLTAGTDLFTVTGNFTTLQGVTLDKNSATGGALVNSSASNLKIQNVNIQNPGTNSGTGTIALTNGSSVLIDTVNFTTTITDTGISVLPVNSAAMDNVVIQNVSGAMGTSLTAFFTDVIVNASGATLSRLSVSRNHLTSTGGCIHVLAGSVGAVVDYHVDQNECYGSGGSSSTPDGIAMFAGQHGTVNGNVINDKGQGRAGYPLSLNDMADSVASGNTITNSFGFNSGIRMLDSVRDVVANNVVNGIGNAVGLNGLLISTAATSGASSDNIITGNIMTFVGGAAGTCFTIDEGTSSGVTNNTLVAENKCIGDGSANQVGITFSRSSTGTTNNSRVTGNVLQNLVTGISIGSGVVGTSVGPQTFINTKVEYSDSGTTTHYDPQCHTYTLGVATTNFTVTQDGGPVNNTTVATATTQSVSLFALCPLCVVTGITVKSNTAWAATGLTSLLSTVGDSVAGTTIYTSSTYDMRAAVTNTNFQDTALFKHGTQAGSSVQASLVANQNLTANQLSGSTDYRVCWAAQ